MCVYVTCVYDIHMWLYACIHMEVCLLFAMLLLIDLAPFYTPGVFV